jgi:hypothetical protein
MVSRQASVEVVAGEVAPCAVRDVVVPRMASGKKALHCDTLMIRSIELTLVKRRSTWAITSKTSPTTPNDPLVNLGQPLVKNLLKTP